MQEKADLRRQDFWMALFMIAASLFFLFATSDIPFFRANAAGVESGRWYNSAALVPYGVFAAILLLSIALLIIAVRQGGAPRWASGIAGSAGSGIAWRGFTGRGFTGRGFTGWGITGWIRGRSGARMSAAALIMLAYIFALVPRVDFVIASALVLATLIYGFHEVRARATLTALTAVLIPAAYALLAHFPQAEWASPHDDDWVALVAFATLCATMIAEVRAAKGRVDGYIRAVPVIALLVPLFLVIVMAFGFRQNVPNRTGLLFKQIEYHYYVTVKPRLAGGKSR